MREIPCNALLLFTKKEEYGFIGGQDEQKYSERLRTGYR